MRRAFLGLAAVCAVALVAALAGGAATLPGGTPITVSITAPGGSVTLPAAPFVVSGTASVGVGAAVANTTLIYIVDVSGSTSAGTGTPGRCPRQNVYDAPADTTLDCELLAVRDLNTAAAATGTVSKIGLIGFAGVSSGDTPTTILSAAALDLSPGGGAAATLAAPDANDYVPPAGTTTAFPVHTNLDWVVQSAYLGAESVPPGLFGWPAHGPSDGFMLFTPHDVGTGTNYSAALYALRSLLTSVTTPRTIVAFLSDGFPNLTVGGLPLSAPLTLLPGPATGLTIYTFAIGGGADCGAPGGTFDGTLAQISARYGTTCRNLLNPADAATIVPAVIASQLTSVGLTVDGVPQTGVSTTPTVPRPGPTSVLFTKSLDFPARPAPYTICATAAGHDGAGNGTADPSCIQVTIQEPPTVTLPGNVGPVPEGTSAPLTADVTGATTTHWAVSGGTGHCTIADDAVVPTSVTCDDNGAYTVTLTVSDGVNDPVVASETLQVDNVAPVPTLVLSPGTIPLHGTVNAHTTIVDPGTNDTQTCSNAWGDGTPDTPGCDDSHTYDTAGTYTVTTTATDDDGGSGISTALVVVDGPPIVTVTDAAGAEGSAIPLNATANDPEHDALTYHWTVTPAAGIDAGATCTFSDALALAPTITCTDDGSWTITLTVRDNVNIDVVSSGTLTVSNVAPSATLTLTPGSIPLHGSVAAHTAITDLGSNDTQTCSINWGDGTPDTTGCDAGHTYDIPGPHTATVTVTDDDGGSTTATAGVLVNGPPLVSVSNASGNEGAAIPLTAAASDPEHDPLTYAWTATPAGSVDAGATCTFGNPAALATTVTCTDDGTWTITLRVTDGVNAPVANSGTLTVANAAPTLLVSNPAAGGSSRNVVFNGIVTDPGSNDTQTCQINWGDGSALQTVPVAGGFCNATHSYASSLAGATIDVAATDDDGGVSAHVTRVLTFNQAPVCVNVHAIPATLWPPNGKFRLVLLSGATDPDGDHITYAIVSVTQDEALGKFDDDHHAKDEDDDDHYKKSKKLVPDAVRGIGPVVFLRAWRDPHGDGRVYTIAFTVTDSHGASCSGTTTVTVPHDEHHPAVKTPGVSVNSFGS